MINQSVSTDTLERLKAIVGEKAYIDDINDMASYLTDERGVIKNSQSPLILKPANTEEVSAIVRLCNEAGIGIVPQGGNTGLVGGSIPSSDGGEIVLSLERLNKIRDVDDTNNTMTAEAGCILANVQNAAEEVDRLYPLSMASEGSCQIGGNLATNAGGTAVLQYGNTRDLVLGIEVVLPSGEIWNGLRRLRKDNTGYDLKHLFIGSEGTLGIITAVVLKLFPQPVERATAMVAIRSLEDAPTLLGTLRKASGDQITAFEYIDAACMKILVEHTDLKNPFDEAHNEVPDEGQNEKYQHYALVELSSSRAEAGLSELLETALGNAYEEGMVVDAVVASSVSQAKMLWNLRETLPETYKKVSAFIAMDVSVPVSKTPEFIKQAKQFCENIIEKTIENTTESTIKAGYVIAFGHIGDGNIHFLFMQAADIKENEFLSLKPKVSKGVHDIALSLDGSFSAEHGIGTFKKEALAHYKSSIELDLMRGFKQTIDPNNIMNPGKIL